MDFDWFFYIATVHLNMSEDNFWRSTPKKVGSLWKTHIKFNGWNVKNEDNNEISSNGVIYKKMNIEDIPFL